MSEPAQPAQPAQGLPSLPSLLKREIKVNDGYMNTAGTTT